MFEIEKNVPMPEPKTRAVWPWARMEVGDSVSIPDGMTKFAKNSLNSYSAYSKKRFARRTEDCGVMRVWRIT